MNLHMKELMLSGAVIASLLSAAPANATGTEISLIIASNVTAPINALIADFVVTNSSYTVTYVSGSSGTLLNSITNAATTGTWDIFLSADNTRPAALYNYTNATHPTAPWLTAGIPFLYAVGTLVFWTNNTVDGLDESTVANVIAGYSPGHYDDEDPVVIALPSSAPYGYAASQFLATLGVNLPATSVVSTPTNIDLTYAAISTHNPEQGFVALSQVCNAAGPAKYPNLGAAHPIPEVVYSPAGATSVAGQGQVTINYDTIIQAGIKLANTYTDSTHQSAVNAFVTYLTSPAAKAIFKSYCYRTPA